MIILVCSAVEVRRLCLCLDGSCGRRDHSVLASAGQKGQLRRMKILPGWCVGHKHCGVGVWVEGTEEGQVQRLKKHQTPRGHRECPGPPHPPLHQPRQHRGCRLGQEDLDGGGLHLRCKIEKRLCNLIGPMPVNRRLCAQSTDIRRFWVRIPGRLHDDLLAQR